SEQLQGAADDWAAGGDCPATDEPGGGGGRGRGIGGSGGGHGAVELSVESGRDEPGGCDQQRAGAHECAVERCRQLCGGGGQCVWFGAKLQRGAERGVGAGDCGPAYGPGGPNRRGGGF